MELLLAACQAARMNSEPLVHFFGSVHKMTLPILVGNLVLAGFVLVLILAVASGINRGKDHD